MTGEFRIKLDGTVSGTIRALKPPPTGDEGLIEMSEPICAAEAEWNK
jgi:hypothetical protein